MTSLLLVAFLFLIAGVIAVPIASRFGLGSVLGYLLAGIAISPILYALNIDVISIQHIAEFGVVMMLFLVGLELEPRMLWQMKTRLIGLGGLQVCVTTALITGIAMLFGFYWTIALAIGLVLCLSSTAIVLQSLNEKGLMKSDGGQAGFSVLLFQDIAVIPMLALIPLLAMPELMDTASSAAEHVSGTGSHSETEGGHGVGDEADHDSGHESGLSLVEHLHGWQRAAVTLGAIAAVIVCGYFLVRPLFRYIAMANLREIFVATALMLVVGIALLMSLVGLSPALGTFLAGVVLATSEYRHELESDIDPFKGLLLGLFFITVGASINFSLLGENLLLILGLTIGLILLKAFVLLVLSFIFKVNGGDRWLFSLSLAQAGEFGFVLLSFTVANQVIPESVADKLLLCVALSMLLTPLLFVAYDRLIAPRFVKSDAREPDTIDEKGKVIIAGIGRFGGVINRILKSAGHNTVVVDHNAASLETFRKFGIHAYYGDATRPDLLHAAGIDEADLLVVAIDDESQINSIVHYVRHNYPDIHIVARAISRHHVYALYAAGANDIIRDTFDSATRAGRSALEALGVHSYEAEKLIKGFVEFDQYALREVASVFDENIPAGENQAYIDKVKSIMPLQDAAMQGKTDMFSGSYGRGWIPPGKTTDQDSEQ